MNFEIKIEIKGNRAKLLLCDIDEKKNIAEVNWEDKRDLSDKLFVKINSLLKKKKVFLKDVRKVSFDCDSPYFVQSKKGEIKMEDLDSTGKCGFTAWQTGEIISKVMNFAIGDR
jgi:hypothetical protein